MPLLLLGFILFAILATIALTPVILIQRYRVGTARRRARVWSATLNLVAFSISSTLFLGSAFAVSFWVPNALSHAAAGFAGGGVLGLLGLALTRWEAAPGLLHYRPNRWLVLGITLVVTARITFGFWRSWQAWRATPEDFAWAVSAGVPGSLAAGAVVLGYYLTYWVGVRRRVRRVEVRRVRRSWF